MSIASETKALSLFSGAGGLDLGLEQAGWSLVAQLDADPDCADTLSVQAKHREQGTVVLSNPIEAVPPRALRSELGLAHGDLDLLAGGPPCQPFTTSGRRRALRDPRAASLFPAYLEYVDEFAPRALLIENVDGMLSAALKHRPVDRRGREHPRLRSEERKGSFLKWLVDELVRRGYALAWGVVETAAYGVPQLRQRAIVLAVRGSEPCYLPPPTHGFVGCPPYRTLAYALRGITELGPIQPLSARKRAVYEHVPPGGNWRDLPESIRKRTMGAAYTATGGKSGWWRRLAWNLPAPTILGMPDHSSTALIHPEDTRCLSVNECAAIQTFPPDYEFAGGPRSQYQQIGNAVPPQLGRVLGGHLANYLRGFRYPEPPTAVWRKESGNRRVGTHGWAVPSSGEVRYKITSAVRPDHIWASLGHAQDGA